MIKHIMNNKLGMPNERVVPREIKVKGGSLSAKEMTVSGIKFTPSYIRTESIKEGGVSRYRYSFKSTQVKCPSCGIHQYKNQGACKVERLKGNPNLLMYSCNFCDAPLVAYFPTTHYVVVAKENNIFQRYFRRTVINIENFIRKLAGVHDA